MQRLARLDISGLLQHVIVRGIERRDIFSNDIDWKNMILSNHFNMLLMPAATSLASFMRRLLTGYAMSFNRRHSRSEHLFQNHYKSIVCEEDPYLLELGKYIHLTRVMKRLAWYKKVMGEKVAFSSEMALRLSITLGRSPKGPSGAY